jgi:hypothetical protein
VVCLRLVAASARSFLSGPTFAIDRGGKTRHRSGMKLVVIAIVLVLARPSYACGVPDLAAALDAFKIDSEPIHTPEVIAGGGNGYSVDVGYAWGTNETGFMAFGSHVQRVLLDVHMNDSAMTSGAATYGVLAALGGIYDGGLDVGAVLDAHGVGPVGRVTVGVGGFDFRLTGDLAYDGTVHAEHRAEVMVDVMRLVGRI